jgi:hypothetical protein
MQDNGQHHYHWARGSKERPFLNHFTSFTISFDFAFAYAVRKLRNKERKSRLLVLDPYKLRGRVLIFSSFPFIRAYEIQSEIIRNPPSPNPSSRTRSLLISEWPTLPIYSKPSEALQAIALMVLWLSYPSFPYTHSQSRERRGFL